MLKRTMALAMSLVLMLGLLPVESMGSVEASASEAPETMASSEMVSAGERKIKINDDWKFRLLDTSRAINNSLDATASQENYAEEETWNTVQLPHDWSIYQEFTSDGNVARAAQGAPVSYTHLTLPTIA